ncbi:glycosyltransferase [bacterium]|nr:glycosyltransferase [bacterium]
MINKHINGNLHLPLISVVIATYNAEATVEKAVLSVLDQTYPSIELIIVDGVSNDLTLTKVNKHIDDRVTIITERDLGIYDAWNKGVKLSSGEWLIFIGADDYFTKKTSLAELWENTIHLANIDLINVVYGRLIALDKNGLAMGIVGDKWRDPWTFSGRFFRANFPIPIMASLIRKKAIVKAGGFNLNYTIIADIDLVLKIAKKDPPIYLGNIDVTSMGYGGVSTKPEKALLLLKESFLVRKSHGLGAFSNFGFLMLSLKQNIKYVVLTYFGSSIADKMMHGFHGLKRFIIKQ